MKSRLASSYIASVLKTPAGGDAHLSMSRTFQRCTRFSWHCNTNCKLHTDEGRVCLPFLLSRAVCVRSPWLQCYCNALQRVRFLPSFAVIVCAWVRLCALSRCLRLFICRLRGFYCFCSTFVRLARFRASCGLYCSRFCCSLFCAPSVRIFNASEGQRKEAWGTSPPPPWVRFIVCASRPRLAAVFPLLNNCGRRRGR